MKEIGDSSKYHSKTPLAMKTFRKRNVAESSSRLDRQEQSPTLRKNVGSLLEWDELMEWQRDNEYVLTGYRPASYSLSLSAQSILQLHNETINIWTHLLGACLFSLFLPFSYYVIAPRYSTASNTDTLALGIFFSGVAICFILSTIFHTFSNHSKEGHRLGGQLDHLGIVIVIWGSAIPTDYFGFYCDPKLQYLYWAMATVSAISSAIFTLRPVFRTPKYRPFRSIMYGILGLSIFIPAVHGVTRHGWTLQNQRMSLTYFLGLGILNATGTVIYTARIPERWYPRHFDIYGSSHQIMHVLVICGAFSHTMGLVKAFDYWQAFKLMEEGACAST